MHNGYIKIVGKRILRPGLPTNAIYGWDVLFAAGAGLELLEEVIALVIHEDEGGEVLYSDLPDSLHAELGILNALDALDAAL